jgi:hypothetical protein
MTINRSTQSVKDSIKNDLLDGLRNFLTGGFPTDNVLHNYRVFNYNVTLAVVSPAELSSGSYKKNLDYIVFQSHGKSVTGMPPIASGSKTLDKIAGVLGQLAGMKDNKWDFYLQELYIKNAVTPQRDIGTEFRLKILEPYGIDTFLTTVMEGLRLKKIENFGAGSPFILKIDFVGYKDDRDEPEVIPFSTRYYPVIIAEMQANLSQEGTVYTLSGTPVNDLGKMNNVNSIPENFTLTGETVQDMLKNLEESVNKVTSDQAKEAGYIPHKYLIKFVKENGKTISVDDPHLGKILKAKMYDPDTDQGHKGFLLPKNSYIQLSAFSENVTRSEYGKMLFSFSADSGISKIIDTIIVDSYYVVDKLEKRFQGEYLSNGMVPWWRVATKIDIIDFDRKKNYPVFQITYQIIPRSVPWQKLVSLFFPDVKADSEDYEPFCARRYEWSYTGNNRDILSFKINFDQFLTRIISKNLGKSGSEPGQSKSAQGNNMQEPKAQTVGGSVPSVASNNSGNITQENSSKSGDVTSARPSNETNPLFSLAKDVNDLINSTTENIVFEMEILGDPMWMGTQFVDNTNFLDPSVSQLYTTDGGIAMRTIDPCVRVIAYAPRDFNNDGFLVTGGSDQDRLASEWSAYYMVTEVESYFQNGTFKQKLSGYRLSKTDMIKTQKNWNPIGLKG